MDQLALMPLWFESITVCLCGDIGLGRANEANMWASADVDGVDNSESGLTYPRPVLSNSDGLDSGTKRKATSMVVGDDG